jgi:hypothetical protein
MPLAKPRSTTILRSWRPRARFVFPRTLSYGNTSIGIGWRRQADRPAPSFWISSRYPATQLTRRMPVEAGTTSSAPGRAALRVGRVGTVCHSLAPGAPWVTCGICRCSQWHDRQRSQDSARNQDKLPHLKILLIRRSSRNHVQAPRCTDQDTCPVMQCTAWRPSSRLLSRAAQVLGLTTILK